MNPRFLRHIEKREVDFVVLKNKKPLYAVECRTAEKTIPPDLNTLKPERVFHYFIRIILVRNPKNQMR